MAEDKENIFAATALDFFRGHSEAGHKLFFRILFDEEATIIYPRDNMLRVSDGQWSTDKIIRVTEDGLKSAITDKSCGTTLLLAVPVHPPKFNHVDKLLQSFATFVHENVGIVMIFSNVQDMQMFKLDFYTPLDERVSMFVVSPDMRNPVTSKKLRAVEFIFQTLKCTQWVMTPDSELLFASNESVIPRIQRLLETRTIYGTELSILPHTFGDILRASCMAVGVHHGELMDSYTWWSDLPLYEKKIFFAFMEVFDWRALRWEVFDHLSYQCFKVHAQNWTAKKLDFRPEYANCDDYARTPGYSPLW
eukprot:CAMPEP_0179629984 /NCGR_PEP_ID=MMETSP0932-20121108/5665_1 /TAXON_ID=548131 ORGANISM="Ostreococcus mediterraneus, Strain clade-D-RCC2596" /NCGR_SAMPLE_ID=MMETSP0932 /ASSEMBLY_ACC=CAM_ASM_000582 /LENGTH=305 /DNA_ID=CAMNT_0021499433 /DNA_START=756 /DNA_END=1673 /DNA_ORIENTATION=+